MKLFSNIANFELKVKSYDEVLEHAKAIRFNENFIEIIGCLLILKKGPKASFHKLLNPSLADVELEETEFDALLTKIKTDETKSVKFIDSGVVPKSTVRLNIDKLIEYSICVMMYEDALYFDKNIVITTDVAEFRGTGILSTKDLILKVDQVTFEQIQEKLK